MKSLGMAPESPGDRHPEAAQVTAHRLGGPEVRPEVETGRDRGARHYHDHEAPASLPQTAMCPRDMHPAVGRRAEAEEAALAWEAQVEELEDPW